jgi:hypothetical protein
MCDNSTVSVASQHSNNMRCAATVHHCESAFVIQSADRIQMLKPEIALDVQLNTNTAFNTSEVGCCFDLESRICRHPFSSQTRHV